MPRQNFRDLRANREGLTELTGVANVRSALQNRLATAKNTLPWRPQYGARLKNYQNLPLTAENMSKIADEVRSALDRDPRVRRVDEIEGASTTDGQVRIKAKIQIINQAEQLEVTL